MSAVHVRLRLGDEFYAIPVEHVLEISEVGALSPVPGAQSSLLGVRNLRGEVLPVFDLAAVLGIRGDGPQRLLVAEQGNLRAGFAIDEATDVGDVPAVLEETQSSLLVGAALDESGLVGVIDVERLFAGLSVELA